jgi:thiopurine S-methyltransferase
MEPGFWHARWRDGLIGFHQPDVNRHLLAHAGRLELGRDARVFVPLCGKSLDMLWFRRQGHGVLGVELSPVAAAAFFTENNIDVTRSQRGAFECWSGDGIEILCGDFFDLDPAFLDGVTAVYDRASLVALPVALRRRYARHIADLIVPGSRLLLVTFEYAQHEMDGPPFSVREDEVHELYDRDFAVQRLDAIDVLEENARFRERGLSAITEKIFLLRRRNQ